MLCDLSKLTFLTILTLLTLLVIVLAACVAPSTGDTSRAAEVPKVVAAATTQLTTANAGISQATAGIRKDTSDLRVKTPAVAQGVVVPAADSIDKHAGDIDAINAKLLTVSVALTNAQADAARTSVAVVELTKDKARLQAENAELKSNEDLYHKLIFWGIVAIAGGIAGVFLLGKLNIDPGYGAIVAIGGGVLMLTTLLVQQLDHALTAIVRPFLITAGVALGIGLALFVAEVIWRKRSGQLSWLKAISVAALTGPVEDVEDLQTGNPTHGAGTTPPVVAGSGGQAVPAPVPTSPVGAGG